MFILTGSAVFFFSHEIYSRLGELEGVVPYGAGFAN